MATSTDEWLAKISGQLDTLIGGGAPTAPLPAPTPARKSPRKGTTSTTVRGD